MHHELDAVGCQQLERILDDLIEQQGITDLILDLSHAGQIDPGLKAILDRIQNRIESLAGLLELRTPAEPTTELLEMADEIPTFIPVEPATE
ncbi:MAG: hypothetical protein OEV40_11845, partial [Acidimicrobiia bacterium]|nr:hypothetical protein [Acidimicrobiia bacterium]